MSLKSFVAKQTFNPGVAGIFVNPFFFARKNLHLNIKRNASYITGRVLDVGCGRKPYQSLFSGAVEYIGMDIENPGHDHSNESIDVFYDGKTFPFPDNSFHSVLTNQVFEHVFNPVEFVLEIKRVLKPGGYLLLTVPFAWDEHEQPYDFGRYSSFGISHLLQINGFKVVNFCKSTRGLTAIVQLFIGYVYKIFYSKNRYLNLLGTIALLSPLTIFGGLISALAPKSDDFYLDNIVLAVKKPTN
jgi:SAM-dependent methyltransferase